MRSRRGSVVDNQLIGHRLTDIQLTDSFNCRRVVCECSWLSGWWSTPELAAEEWHRHAGVSE